jgi:RNA polymerase sigma factor (sigma-70 family)
MVAPRRRPALTPESWDALFNFLDPTRPHKQGPNRDADAEDRFQDIERKLVYFFAGRGCSDPDDRAMDTMLRVAGRCAGLSGAAFADCIAYFYGVARNVDRERLREARRELTNRAAAARDPTLLHAAGRRGGKDEDDDHRCLDQCMATLPNEARRVILSYYGGDTAAIAGHRDLARQLGKSANALRIEIHRIKRTLRRCVTACVQQGVVRVVTS